MAKNVVLIGQLTLWDLKESYEKSCGLSLSHFEVDVLPIAH